MHHNKEVGVKCHIVYQEYIVQWKCLKLKAHTRNSCQKITSINQTNNTSLTAVWKTDKNIGILK